MKVYELIQKLAENRPDDEVVITLPDKTELQIELVSKDYHYDTPVTIAVAEP